MKHLYFKSSLLPVGSAMKLAGTIILLCLLTISTPVWGDNASWMNNTMSPASYFTLGSNTSAATNAQTIGGTSYTHSINMTSSSGQSSNNTNGYYIRFTLTSASNVSVLFMANGGNRSIEICTGWSYSTTTNATQLDNGATPSDGIKGTSSSVSNGSTGTLSINNLAAGTYYICGSGSVSVFKITISSAVVCNANPSDPTGLSAGTITATGATFTITDVANTNNYEIYCTTTSGTPASNVTPTETGTSQTITVSTLSGSTTYYAWVRAVCDASHKSDWVALGSSTFTTLTSPDATYVPQGLHTLTTGTNETIYCTDITAAGTPATDWIVVPSYGTSSQSYSNVSSDANGNPGSITDNLPTSSSVNMIQIKTDGNTYSSEKRVIHMRVKNITGFIAHGKTSNSGRGIAVAWAEDDNTTSLTTFPTTDIVSMTRSNNSGSFILQKTGLDNTKEYVLSIYAAGSDDFFYAIELIAPASASTYTVSATVNPAGYGTLSSSSISSIASGTAISTSDNVLTVGASSITATATSATAQYLYAFNNWTKSDGTALPSTVTADLSVYANFTRTGKSYAITLDKQVASNDPTGSVSATFGESMPTITTLPSHANYTFGGFYTAVAGGGTCYYDGEGASQQNSDFEAVSTLYAKFTQTVTLDDNGGTADGSVSVTYNATSAGTPNAPTYAGHSVEAYYAEPECTNKVMEADGTLVNYTGYVEGGKWIHNGATTLYAHWCANHTVTWYVNGEEYTTGSPTTSTNECAGITTMPTAPSALTCSDSFRGWSATNLYGEAVNTPPSDLFTTTAGAPVINGDKTFYAVFADTDAGDERTEEQKKETSFTSVFTSKAWADAGSLWTSGKDGSQKVDQGVKVTDAVSGANATTVASYKGVKEVIVTYSTLASAGAGTIAIEVGGVAMTGSAAVTKTGGTTDRTITYTPASADFLDGNVKITVTCTTNSIHIKSVQVIYSGYHNYRCICPSWTVTPELVTASTPIFITSAASKTVRSQDSLVIVGSGLQKSATLSISSPASKFVLKSRTNTALTTDATGSIDAVGYIYYTPDAGDTSDGLDKNASFTISDGTNTQTVNTALIGRHLPANFVIAAKNGDTWYALPADSANGTPAPVAITVDNATTPTSAAAHDSIIYSWYGQLDTVITKGNGHTTRLEMHGIAPTGGSGHAPLFGSTGNDLGRSGGSTLSGKLGTSYWWIFTQTNTSVSATTDVKYTVKVANGNTKPITLYNNAEKWGLNASGPKNVQEIRLIPACTVSPAEPSISGETDYTAGDEIELTATCSSGTDASTTYTWYKGADWATASASSPVQAASTSGATFTKASCVVGDAGTYWCEAANGACAEHNETGYTITIAEGDCTPKTLAGIEVKDDNEGQNATGDSIAAEGGYKVNLENTTAPHGGETGYKIGSSKYVYLNLASNRYFRDGDTAYVYITQLSDQGDGGLHIFTGTTTAGTEVATVASPALGWNKAVLSGVPDGKSQSLTVHRSSSTTEQNHYIFAFKVIRPCPTDEYSITYHCNDATSGCPSNATEQTALPNPLATPTKTNYTFGGWYTDAALSSAAVAGATLSANADLYAKWTQTVTLNTGSQGSGAAKTPTVVWQATALTGFTAHTASGYTLQGYYTAGSGGVKVLNADGTFAGSAVDGYITSSKWSRTGAAPTLYAQWVAASDCSTSDFVIKKGSSTEFQGCMESTSYDGTATSFTAGSATTVGNAKMTISSYSKGAITRPGSGNTFSIVIEPVSGYYLKSVCWAGKVEDDETVSYYWDNNSGSATTITPQTTSGTGVTYDAPNSTTTKFTASYTDDGDGSGGIWWRNVQVEVCAAGVTTYSVTYDGNDETSGSVPAGVTNYSYGATVTVLDNTGSFAKTNYSFVGWTTNDDGTGSSYVADNTFSITDNTTLYAKWTQAVTFDANTANHGSTGGSATAVWNATGLTGITHATPASGYKLTGYYTAETEGTKVLNSDGTFADDDVTDYITDGKWSRTGAAPTLYAHYESAGALTWNLGVNTSASSLTTDSKSSAFTEIAVANMTNAALTGIDYEDSKKGSLTGKIATPASYDADKYVYVTFQVASGYKFTPSSVKVKAQPVTSAKSVKLVLEDENSHSINFTTASTISGGSTQTVEMTNGSSVYFEGTVTLKIYCYGATDKYRLGTPITIEGEVEESCATMPSYTSMSYSTTDYTVGDTPSAISISGATNVDTYLWKSNTTNDRTGGSAADGTNNESSYTPSTASAGTTYYWCEMTNTTCGITIKTPAVPVNVSTSKSSATVTWTNPGSTPNYGGGEYTIKATVDQTGWDGNAADLVITAPAGIRIYNVTSGTTSSQKWVQANFDVQTSFDRTTYENKIPFTVSADATTGYNAISDENDVSYSACAGAGEGSSYNICVRKAYTKVDNKYYWDNTDGWISSPNPSSSIGSSKATTTMATVFDSVSSTNAEAVYIRTYHDNIKKIRIYADFRANNMTVSNVYKHNDFYTANSKYAVDYSVVYNGDEENEDLGTAAQGYVDITLSDVMMSANDILLVKFNTSRVRPLGAVITEGSAGALNTYLQWSGGFADGATVDKKTTDAYFTYSASKITANTNSLGAITYSSSNTSAATVDATGKVALVAAGETTIKATLAASGCYKKAEISYTLNITEDECTIAAGTLALTSGSATKCSSENVTLTLTGFESGATIQWKDGDTDINNGGNYTIATDGTTSTLTTNQPGTYSVIVTKTCFVRSNRITISDISADASVTKIVDSWYIKNGRLTPDIALWSLSDGATLKSVTWSPSNATGLDVVERDGIIYLEGKEPNTNSSSDVVYTLTATITDACGGDHLESSKTITITHQKNTDKHVLAFVVTGTGKGGFTEGISADQTTNVELYNTIAANFDVLATNIYSTDDEKKLKEYYSQFDILCVTDYPNTQTKGTNSKSYVDALGALIDIRPILTMEAFVSKLANWKEKGISGTPKSPTTRQYSMLLQCKDHEIFAGTELTKVGEGDETMYRVNMVDNTKEDYATLDATYGAGAHEEKKNYNYGGKPALQGFTFDATMAADRLLPLGLIDDGAGNDLQVGIERQAEMSARLMVLGINSYAMERLTDDGQTVVVNALKYLMKKNEEEIADCSTVFVGGADGDETNWMNAANWSTGSLPDNTTHEIRIVAPVVITDGQTIHAKATIKIAPNGKYNGGSDNAEGSITINAGGTLVVDGEILAATAPNYSAPRATSPSDLVLNTSVTKQACLIFDNANGETHATVEMYSPSYWELNGGKKKKYWSYVGVPIQTANIPEYFYGGFTYLYDETSGWIKKGNDTQLHAFEPIGLAAQSGHRETFYGPLASTADQEITLTYTGGAGAGKNMIGNSWTAPIQIANFDASDFGEGATATVMIFNTGNENLHTDVTASAENDGAATAGQWLCIPIGVPSTEGYDGLKVIPAMQAFEVNTSVETTLKLDYDKLVRTGALTNAQAHEPMRAPVRRSVVSKPAKKSIEALLRVRVSGTKTHTDTYLLQDARFSDAFDNGWESEFTAGDNRSAQLYSVSEIGNMAFLAKQDIEGTVLGFAPSRDGNEYTFSFRYTGTEELYLSDLKLQESTLITDNSNYSFTYEEGDTNRFIITATPFIKLMPTGTEDGGTWNVDGVQKVLYKDHMYIIRGGRVFDATGAIVK